MILLPASVIVFFAITGITRSEELDLRESLALEDAKYWPLEQNDTSVSWVSLDGMGITKISSVFRVNAPDLRWLIMDNNLLDRIPSKAFKFFPDLTWISLADNQISRFANDAFSGLDNLRVLDLDDNPISENYFETSISGALPALERLYLRNCRLLFFDLPENMHSLTHLHLSDNYLQIFYPSNKSAVTHLSLDNNELIYVSLFHFNSLVYLNLSNNWLGSIYYDSSMPSADFARDFERQYDYQETPGSVLGLSDTPSLQYLIVSFNKISQIFPFVFEKSEALIHVDLTGNLLTEVEARTFNNLDNLENVLLDSNRLTKIDDRAFVNLPKLKILSLKNNLIGDLHGGAFRELGSKADSIELYLDNNRLSILRSGAFSRIKGLRHIGLSKNRIKTISSRAFSDLPNLVSLVIENQWRGESEDISSEVQTLGIIKSDAFYNLPKLVSIRIRNNSFADIEARAFHTLPALTFLDLSNNNIQHLSALAYHDLPSVEDLHLENNTISKIEPETFPKQLKRLNLAGNPLCQKSSCWHIGELDQLEKLDVSGIIEQFLIDDVANLPANLTVVIGTTEAASDCDG